MTTFTVKGKIPAKSSSRQIVRDPETEKIKIISPSTYYPYLESFKKQVKDLGLDTLSLPKSRKNRLSCFLTVYDNARRQDIDSFPKTVFDCLQKSGVIKNDNKIDFMKVIRLVDKDNPRVIIYLQEMAEVTLKWKHIKQYYSHLLS